jgi:hypothetical protein
MTLAPLLDWRVSYGIGGPFDAVRGVQTSEGIFVLLLGIATLAAAARPKFAVAGIATGLAGGAVTGLYLIAVLDYPVLTDSTEEVRVGLVASLGGAALAAAGGIVALSVSSALYAVSARRDRS